MRNPHLTLVSKTLYELAVCSKLLFQVLILTPPPPETNPILPLASWQPSKGRLPENGPSDLSQKMGDLFHPTAYKAQSDHSLKQRQQAYL